MLNNSTSDEVVLGPIDTRSPLSPSWPIAFSTWLGPTRPEEQADPADTADIAIEARDEAHRLAAAIATLPEGARRAFELHKIDGLSHADLVNAAEAAAKRALMGGHDHVEPEDLDPALAARRAAAGV